MQGIEPILEKSKKPKNYLTVIDKVTKDLCRETALTPTWSKERGVRILPSLPILAEIMDRLRSVLFPGYFGKPDIDMTSLPYHIAANLDSITRLLSGQIVAGLCFSCGSNSLPCKDCEEEGNKLALIFLEKMPEIKKLLAGDAKAAFEGDPAAKSIGETIFCYPSMTAMFHHRIAHELQNLGVPVIPRIISEMAHSSTGIDIHPGATIGEEFFIDHGTGVVIGETCIIGKNCRLYQGVTLGALSFPKNEDGSLIKGIPRHPILKDNVTVYAGATILGRVTIGSNSVIGGNVWITKDVPDGGRISQPYA